jgi:TonB family protein
MIELPDGLWVDVVSHLWQTTIVLGVLALLAIAMRRAPARLLNALWWIGLAKLLVPVQLVAPLIRRPIDPLGAEANAGGLRLPSITVWLERAAPVLDPAAAGREAPGSGVPGIVLVVLWAAGVVWLCASLVRARRTSTIGAVVDHGELPRDLRARLETALEGTRIPSATIRVTRASVMPATIGVFRRAIILPEALIARLDARELRAVLLHEDAHRRRLDPLQAAVRRAATVAFYFFPLLWPLLWRLRDTSEMACDEAAVRRGVPPTDYARALARTMTIGLEPLGFEAALARGRPSLTRRRFDRLAHEGRFVIMRKHWLCLAIAGLAVVTISGTGLALADRGEPIGVPEAGLATRESKKAAKKLVKNEAKEIAKTIARGAARVFAPDLHEAPPVVAAARAVHAALADAAAEEELAALEAAAADEVAALEAAAAEQEAAAAEAEEELMEAAAEKAAEEEEAAAAEEAAAKEEAASEEKTYTITLEEIVDPVYPEDAKRDGVGGKVTLKLTLTPDGEVGDVWTLTEVEGYPSLSEAAELAAHKWTFKIDGEPESDVEVIVPVEFKMRGKRTMEMSVRIPDEAEVPEAPDEPDAPAPPDAPEPEEPPATDEVPPPDDPDAP